MNTNFPPPGPGMQPPTGACAPPATLPAAVGRSRLMGRGGFDVFEGLVEEALRRRLLDEAVANLRQATDCEVVNPDREETRGGMPPRRFRSGPGGPVQDAFYRAPWALAFLRRLTCRALAPTGERGTYSYYARPGDYLATHRDVAGCDLAVITCLNNGAEAGGSGGRLCLYPERLFEPLSAVRATPDEGALKLRLEVGQTLVMYGGLIPHGLLPIGPGQARIVSVLCYRLP